MNTPPDTIGETPAPAFDHRVDAVREQVMNDALDIVDDAEASERREAEFATWVREVREPASYRSEGPRRVVAGGNRGCRVDYQVAPLPDGRWALRFEFEFPGFSSGGTDWTVYPTREACIEGLKRYVTDRCTRDMGDSCMTQANRRAAPMMLKIFDPGDLFGFQEPDPTPRERWYPEMILDKIESLTLWRSFELLDVVRGTDCKPISKSGSFFEIPLPWTKEKPGNRWNDEADGEGEMED